MREQVRVVLAAAAAQADRVADVREDAVAVPLHFVGEFGAVFVLEGDVAAGGGGGQHRRQHGRGAGLAAGELEQPVFLVGADEREAARDATQPAAVASAEDGDDFAVAPLFNLAGADVPDFHRARAVLALRDGALELGVLDRVVLGLHREAVDVRFQRRALRHRPGDEHPVVLQAEIPVQVGGIVLADDENRLTRARGGGSVGNGLAGLVLVAHGAVGGQPVLPRCAEVGDRVEPVLDARDDLVELQLREVRVRDLIPGARRRHGGARFPAQRVRADCGFLPVVLAPVDEHAPRALRLRHGGGDPVRVRALQVLREGFGHVGHSNGVAGAVQARVQVDALGPGGHRHAGQPHVLEDFAAHQRHLGGVV